MADDKSRFKAGDLTRLASGGPSLTVVSVQKVSGGGRRVAVSWFNEVNNVKSHEFPEACLDGPPRTKKD